MRVAGLMSGSGTNIIKILEKQRELKEQEGESPYQLSCLFSDVADPNRCKIREIARQFNIEYKVKDIKNFYESHGHNSIRDMNLRQEYDKNTLGYLRETRIDCVALGGYMSIVTDVIFNVIPTINVHPADLSIIDKETGRRKFTGDHAVRDAILAGEPEIRSSTHIATAEVDGGPLLIISNPVNIELPDSISIEDLKKEENKQLLEEIVASHQNRLKEIGDWVIFPLTFIKIARGLVAIDEKGLVYIEDQACPNGLKV